MELESFYRTLLDNLGDGVYFVDKDRKINFWNKTAEQISGYSSAEVLGHACSENILVHIDENSNPLCLNGCPLAASMGDGTSRQSTVYMLHKDGHRVSVNVRVNPLFDENNNIVGAIEIFRENSWDIVLHQRLSDLERLSLIDELTGVGNRRFAEISLRSKFDELQRYSWQFGVIFSDIDNFKRVNDSYGHEIGDKVLKFVAGTMRESVRSMDAVFRWGGEEFIVIIPNTDATGLHNVADRIRFMVEASELAVGDERLKVTVSLGATMVKPGDDQESIVERADRFMYQSKSAGKNRVTVDNI